MTQLHRAIFVGLVLSIVSSLGVSLAMSPVFAAEDPATPSAPHHAGWSFTDFRHIPIQSGGRVKPLDSFAREASLFMTGRRIFEGFDPADLILSWLAFPHVWEEKRFVKISRIDVRRELQLDESRTYFSPHELFGNFALLQYARNMDAEANATGSETMSGKTDRGKKQGPREQELGNVLSRLTLFRDMVAGNSWLVLPRANVPWVSLAGTEAATKDSAAGGSASAASAAATASDEAIRTAFVDVVKAYQANDLTAFEQASKETRSKVEAQVPDWDSHLQRSLSFEVFYNRLRPFQMAWIFYLLGALMWLVSPGKLIRFNPVTAAKGARIRRGIAATFTSLAILCHVGGFSIRCYIAGRPPVTNMYESIIWVSFGVFAFAFILYLIQRLSITLIVASALATVGLIAADSAPAMMDPGLHPLVPVLRDNFWLTIHVLTITLGYSAFALTLGLADVTLWNFFSVDRKKKSDSNAAQFAQMARIRIQTINQLTYRAMQFGVVLLAAGTILGGVWADYSWGRFWGWDPKEVWALIALLCYLAVLHGRMTSWIKPFAFAAWTVVAFSSVVMAWYGVNFVLGVGLHSYGFASGGTGYILGAVGLQLAYVIGIAINHQWTNRAKTAV
jgi:cytochrome c-type biogenesis protein CcsB